MIEEIMQKVIEYDAYYVYSVNVERNESNYFDLNLTLSDFPFDNKTKIKITCHNTVDFKLGNLTPLFCSQLSIIDISSRQLEHIKYKVIDDEYGLFEIFCEDISYTRTI